MGISDTRVMLFCKAFDCATINFVAVNQDGSPTLTISVLSDLIFA